MGRLEREIADLESRLAAVEASEAAPEYRARVRYFIRCLSFYNMKPRERMAAARRLAACRETPADRMRAHAAAERLLLGEPPESPESRERAELDRERYRAWQDFQDAYRRGDIDAAAEHKRRCEELRRQKTERFPVTLEG